MNVNFIKTSPAQNMTILVKDSLSRSDHWKVAQQLMRYESVYAEQVGFIEPASDPAACLRLQMMGGEFCGNATMSLAAVAARDGGLKAGETTKVMLEVSGAENILECDVTAEEGAFTCKVEMPAPKGIEKISFNAAGKSVETDIVRLPGISHVIVNDVLHSAQKTFAEDAVADLIGKIEDEAFGIMLFDEKKQFMVPVVYVKDIGAMTWEHGCASGSAAVCAYFANRAGKDTELEVRQPGGTITATAKSPGTKMRLWVKTSVRIVAEGVAYI